jgi:hypothetical protein
MIPSVSVSKGLGLSDVEVGNKGISVKRGAEGLDYSR